MKIPLANNTLIIIAAIGLIVVSSAALSFFSYHYTVGRENVAETTLTQSIIKLALQNIDRLEQRILDNDRIMAAMIDVNDPLNWPSMVEAIKDADLNVEQVYLLRPESNYPVFPQYSYEIRNQWGAFRKNFDLKEIELERLVPGQPYHLHKEKPNNYFFATYMLREGRDGSRYLVCFQMNFDKIIAMLDKYLRDLQDRFYVSIVDFENNAVYNQPVSRSSTYFFESRFPTTLYKWILQIVPRNYAELQLGVRNQRLTNLFFITLSMLLIFISLAFIYVGWQRDRQLRQMKESFISNVSHELKTPLSLIRMFSEILVLGKVNRDDKRLEYYRIIHNESDRMSRLIDNLLDFANLAQGIEYKHFEKTDIARLVTKAMEAYRYEIQKQGFQLKMTAASDIPEIFADPNAITMAFFNLLDNSVKYSGERKYIEVRLEKTDGFLDLSVIDKGIGISPSERQKIFDKFYRGSEPAIRKVRGSGIGLAITKHVAEIHGGEVLVHSEVGKGSEFTLRIPIREAPGF